MNYWWVNQNQTHNEEISGGYMWSPKMKSDGSRNVFYENMTRVRPGDIVFSFFNAKISYLSIIASASYLSPKPEFRTREESWASDGWMVNVKYRKLTNAIRPKDHIRKIREFLPTKYSPLQRNGNGVQTVYLTSLPAPLAKKILSIIGRESEAIISEGLEYLGDEKTQREAEEERIEKLIKMDHSIESTEKEAIVKARKGQGRFREEVISLHKECIFTRVRNPNFLRAGHIKPWAKCENNEERLDPLNGILLTPLADYLVDQGYISFDHDGKILFSPELDPVEAKAMGIDIESDLHIKLVDERQLKYLDYHRTRIFKKKQK